MYGVAINSGERGFGLPKFSRGERARRWGRVRELMRQQHLDAIVVFPESGDVTAFVRGGNEVEWWSIAQDWVTDIRATRRSWGEPVAERVKELKLEEARIGVSGLSGLLRAPEGTVVSGMIERLRTTFPKAQFENATELLQDARSIKGPEEIACVEQAAAILDKVVEAILANARPGVMENQMVATIWYTMIANGGDYPSMTHWGAGLGVPWASRIAPHRPLQAGDMINTELEAKYGGYIAQTVQAACLGTISPELKRSFDVSVEVFDELVKFMKPGISFREVVRFYQRLVRDSGHTPKGMLLHGRGIGEDRPQITGELDDNVHGATTYTMHLDLPLIEGNVFVLKPGAMSEKAPDSIRCGDTVVITPNGARRLGKRRFTFPELL